jgi:hypothetical protein
MNMDRLKISSHIKQIRDRVESLTWYFRPESNSTSAMHIHLDAGTTKITLLIGLGNAAN